MNLKKMENKLKEKVQHEYEVGYEAIRDAREDRQEVLEHVFEKPKQNKAKVNLIFKNMKLNQALYLSDKTITTFASEGGELVREQMQNMNKVIASDMEKSDYKDIKATIINECDLYGLTVTVIDGYDETTNTPIINTIHPLSVIIDPNNWTGSNMRFVGFTRRVTKDSLKNNPAYEVDVEQISNDIEMDKNKAKEGVF